jgi:hypothetical protein
MQEINFSFAELCSRIVTCRLVKQKYENELSSYLFLSSDNNNLSQMHRTIHYIEMEKTRIESTMLKLKTQIDIMTNYLSNIKSLQEAIILVEKDLVNLSCRYLAQMNADEIKRQLGFESLSKEIEETLFKIEDLKNKKFVRRKFYERSNLIRSKENIKKYQTYLDDCFSKDSELYEAYREYYLNKKKDDSELDQKHKDFEEKFKCDTPISYLCNLKEDPLDSNERVYLLLAKISESEKEREILKYEEKLKSLTKARMDIENFVVICLEQAKKGRLIDDIKTFFEVQKQSS